MQAHIRNNRHKTTIVKKAYLSKSCGFFLATSEFRPVIPWCWDGPQREIVERDYLFRK
jgi:hypothetical protein